MLWLKKRKNLSENRKDKRQLNKINALKNTRANNKQRKKEKSLRNIRTKCAEFFYYKTALAKPSSDLTSANRYQINCNKTQLVKIKFLNSLFSKIGRASCRERV